MAKELKAQVAKQKEKLTIYKEKEKHTKEERIKIQKELNEAQWEGN